MVLNSRNNVCQPLPCEQSPLIFLHGTAHRSERDSAELVYILCGADNPKTWIIMCNFRFDTGFITGFTTKPETAY
jgi:hypothetical protein